MSNSIIRSNENLEDGISFNQYVPLDLYFSGNVTLQNTPGRNQSQIIQTHCFFQRLPVKEWLWKIWIYTVL